MGSPGLASGAGKRSGKTARANECVIPSAKLKRRQLLQAIARHDLSAGRFADHLWTGVTSRASLLRKPTAGVANAALRQGVSVAPRPEMLHHAVNKPASASRPLHAAVLHAGAGEAQPVLRHDAVFLECIQHLRGYRRVWGDIYDLAGSRDHSQQDRARLWGRARTRECGFLGAHRRNPSQLHAVWSAARFWSVGGLQHLAPFCRHEC